MPSLFSALLAASATFAVCGCAGRLLLGRRHVGPGATLALGAALLSTAVFVLLALGQARRGSFLILGLAVIGTTAWREQWWLRRSELAAWRPSRPALPLLPLTILLVFAGLYAIYALAPDLQPDSAGYHLGLVNEWARTRTLPDRVSFYDMLPHGLEMLFLFAFAFGRHTAATLIHCGFLLASVPLLLRVARRLELPRWAGATAAVLWFCSPVVGLDGSSAYNDVALAFCGLALFDLLLDSETPPWIAGLVAGFCYGIKLTGAVACVLGIVWWLVRRRPCAAAWFCIAAVAMILPWWIRNTVLAGSPVAPFFNEWWPTPYFHALRETGIRAGMNRLGSLSLLEIPFELTALGGTLQGLLGPVFLTLPLALFSLRERSGRILLAAAALFALPWLANTGTRFLIPMLPFASLALGLALARLGKPPAILVTVAMAISCLPAIVQGYAAPNAWIFRKLPLRAAMRQDDPAVYRRRELWSIAVSELVERYTQPDEPVFDLAGLPYAYTHWIPVGPWQSAAGDRMAAAIQTAAAGTPFEELRLHWSGDSYRALRLVVNRPGSEPWSVSELVLLDGERPLSPRSTWSATAKPYSDEAPLALDNNFATQYRTWSPARPGMRLELDFGGTSLPVNGIRILSPKAGTVDLALEAQSNSGEWHRLSVDRSVSPLPVTDLRWSATRLLRQEGIRYLIAPGQDSSWSTVTTAMREEPDKWGLIHTAENQDVHLFRIR